MGKSKEEQRQKWRNEGATKIEPERIKRLVDGKVVFLSKKANHNVNKKATPKGKIKARKYFQVIKNTFKHK